MARTHTIPSEPVHYLWDASNPPALHVESGDTVLFESRDVSDNQVGPGSTTADLATFDLDRLYPLAGPVHVAGAEPGDTLQIDILSLETRGWGWVAVLPGLGLLADDFPDPVLRIFDLDPAQRGPDGGQVTYLREGIAIPVEPFLGTMGVCPAGAKGQAVMPPGTFGGNIDTRQLTAGSTLLLPVQEPGALFSCGDAHAAQGDGEVCVTGIESPMGGALRFTLHKGRSIPAPQYRVPAGSLTRRVDRGGWFGTTGVGGDLYRAAQDAVRAMIVHLGAMHDLPPEEAYMLCSLAADLKISEIVDAGSYVVSALLPDAVFV